MTSAQILAFLGALLPGIEPMILDGEQNLQTQIKSYLASQNANSDLVQFLTFVDQAMDAFAQAEIKKL